VLAPKSHMPTCPTNELTEVVCWSRMQAESGQELAAIVARKELERRANGGTFFWGVGNPPSQLTSGFAETHADIDVVFSVMKSRPKLVDVSPTEVWIWSAYQRPDGTRVELPQGSIVTSRGHVSSGQKRAHYALMCWADHELQISNLGPFNPDAYRNVGTAGGSVGNSQVTALLRRMEDLPSGGYDVNIKAKLKGDYWVKLTSPSRLSAAQIEMLRTVRDSYSVRDWLELSRELRIHSESLRFESDQLNLF
jgi:hypothetical protein